MRVVSSAGFISNKAICCTTHIRSKEVGTRRRSSVSVEAGEEGGSCRGDLDLRERVRGAGEEERTRRGTGQEKVFTRTLFLIRARLRPARENFCEHVRGRQQQQHKEEADAEADDNEGEDGMVPCLRWTGWEADHAWPLRREMR